MTETRLAMRWRSNGAPAGFFCERPGPVNEPLTKVGVSLRQRSEEGGGMLRPQFVVLESDGLWKIRHDGVNYGPYRTERGAILAAIDAADRTPKSAYEPRVMVQSRFSGKVYVEWTFGDPYPADFAHYRARLAEAREDPGRRKSFVA